MRPRTEADLIEHALERASSDPDMAEDVLEFFCDVVERGDVPDRKVLDYLADCFQRVVAGEKPSDALNLTRPKGQRRRRTLERIDDEYLSLAFAVARCMKAGAKRDDAIEQVVSKCAASTATVKRAYETFGQFARAAITK
jgi:hypothetical protein